jgi:hypothetical protein
MIAIMQKDAMRIFKNHKFKSFAEKEGIDDEALQNVSKDLEEGRVDADLGGGVFKQRLARQGEGKSGGYRLIIFFRKEQRTFFVYGFPKSERENISAIELRQAKRLAKALLNMPDEQLAAELTVGSFVEIKEANHGQNV